MENLTTDTADLSAEEAPMPVAPATLNPEGTQARAARPALTDGLAAVQYVLTPAAVGARSAFYGSDRAGQLWQKWWGTSGKPGNDGSAWECLGAPDMPGGLDGPLTAAYWVDYRYAIYGATLDGGVYRRCWMTNHWAGWEKTGNPGGAQVKVKGLAALHLAVARHIVYAVAGGTLYRNTCVGTGFGSWEVVHHEVREQQGNTTILDPITPNPFVGPLPGPVAAVRYAAGQYAVYPLDAVGEVWQLSYSASQYPNPWQSMGKPLGNDTSRHIVAMAAESYITAQYAIYALDNTGRIHEKYWNAIKWSEWREIRFVGEDFPDYQPGTALAVAFKYLNWYAVYLNDAQGATYVLWYEGTKWASHWQKMA